MCGVRQCGSVRAGLIFAWGDGDDATMTTGDRPARKTALGYSYKGRGVERASLPLQVPARYMSFIQGSSL